MSLLIDVLLFLQEKCRSAAASQLWFSLILVRAVIPADVIIVSYSIVADIILPLGRRILSRAHAQIFVLLRKKAKK